MAKNWRQNTSIGKDMEEPLEFLYIADEWQLVITTSTKDKQMHIVWAITLLDIYLAGRRTYGTPKTCTKVFISILLATVQMLTNSKMHQLWYILKMKHCTALRMN